MTQKEMQVSSLEDLAGAVGAELVRLPVGKANGEPVVVKVGPVPTDLLILAGKGIAGTASAQVGEMSWGEVVKLLEETEEPFRRLASVGLLEPRVDFSDTPTAGTYHWRDMHPRNRQAIVNAIIRISGYAPDEEGRAEDLSNFPAGEQGGGSNGGGTGDGL